MPKKDKHAATNEMFRSWAVARPCVPIPFEHKIKGEGKIIVTWADIKDRLNRDSTSYSLAFSTAHIAPSITQANVLHELSVRDERLFRKFRKLEDEKEAKLGAEKQRNEESVSSGNNNNATKNSSSSSNNHNDGRAKSTMIGARRNFLTEVERETLVESEGGGRGRVAFLKERNKLPLNVRYGGMPRTSNQMYGHGQLNNDHREELTEYCRDVQRSSKGISLPELQRRPPQAGKFVSEFVPAEIARQCQIPPEFAALTARPNKSIPFALSIIDGPGSVNDPAVTAGGNPISDAEAAVAAASQAAAEKRQSDQHRHARGDFRKRTFTANTRATGIFPGGEWV